MIKTLATCCCIGLAATVALPTVADAEAPAAEAETLEQELQAARDRLDEAAREVARLAAQAPGMAALLEQSMGWSGRAMLGLNMAPAESSASTDGVRVAGVTPDGPAALAGVRAGDVIEAIDGQSLAVADGSRASRRLNELLRGVQPGQEVTLRVRREGDLQDITVTAQAAGAGVLESLRGILPRDWSVPEDWRDAPRRWSAAVRAGSGPWGQLEMVSMTPGLGEYFGTDQGLLVLRVAEGSALPLRDGDVLLAIGGREPSSPEHALRILASYEPGESVDLEVMRRERREQLLLTVPASAPASGTEN